MKEGVQALERRRLARCGCRAISQSQALTSQDVGDADSLVLPEIGVALVSGAPVRGERPQRPGRDRLRQPDRVDRSGVLRLRQRLDRLPARVLARGRGDREGHGSGARIADAGTGGRRGLQVVGATWGLRQMPGAAELAQRRRHQGRRARHRHGPRPSRLRRTFDHRARPSSASRCRICTATAPTASARPAVRSRRRARRRATASPTSRRSSPARCCPTPARRAGRHPGRHELGDREPVRRHLDVARIGRRRCSRPTPRRARRR